MHIGSVASTVDPGGTRMIRSSPSVGRRFPDLSKLRVLRVVSALALLTLVVGTPSPAAADAGADLALSASRGPVGTTLDLWSADVFSMDADECPDDDGTRTWDDGDTFEIRWELGVLADGVVGSPVAEGSDFRYTTLGAEVVDVVGAGALPTQPGVAWKTAVTVPDGVLPGQRLVVNASCWRIGDAVQGGEVEWLSYYYLPVFTVTDVDGSVPTTEPVLPIPPATPTSSSTVAPRPGGPAPGAPPAVARPGAASFTG